ncbi:XRE family transcriptional regulator [Streptomyces sp. WAC05374]|uniref:helix-turn-helix domain-containing protein n=1 Tax=Streptomyces sp. WAC05374 TaxID=2487420 RepID=UPI000F8731E3|nr:helix-turn-helix transcriptional regulator [Streptomyces sp. WAC05374]RST13762.1 XRE family transcriptional regulator [Streptomyces sp. WAC05374]TDF46946.1 XRE family transcriptional regulator [Streptomyces sp. WAC05374]TDF57202.1 XRE family transcriptional regulator [Streptomyces sp. WAC05374]TDF61305.1 XRE family transcriptional regulator [Streptomyces sp. WAC05374]
MTDEPEQDVDLEDDSGAVIAAVGRQVRLWREAASMRAADLGAAIGYGENQVYKVEAGKRIPKPEFLDRADEALGAGGKLAAMKKDVAEARYPKKVRDLAKLEADAVEMGAYAAGVVHGLLQTEEYARALYGERRPAFSEDQVEHFLAARMARQAVFERQPAPLLTFVQEEATLRRPTGGTMVLRRQLEHLLELSVLRHVEIQVMPTETEEHAGLNGSHRVLKLSDGTAVGHIEAPLTSRLVSDPKVVQILEMRYGMIRAQALTPRSSRTFIEKLLGET